ncbi:hypothetical protein E1301_Tti013824 [Triplophysa tibetana]|uniref:Uncharacterized protein n=1 Tax=Triplophysa tibetana TaxID=1572043 RepID=A0A5A9P7E6_9TELE|nr:hypothetical protein E1301_Tti013824 [Triplophysa tibetana]
MQPLRDAELKIDALHLLEWAVKSKLHADCLTITALTSVRCRKIALALSEGESTGSWEAHPNPWLPPPRASGNTDGGVDVHALDLPSRRGWNSQFSVEEEIPPSQGVWEEKSSVSGDVVCCKLCFQRNLYLPLVVGNSPQSRMGAERHSKTVRERHYGSHFLTGEEESSYKAVLNRIVER